MLGRNKGGAHTLIDGNARVLGDVHFTGDLHVQGQVQGNLLAGAEGGDLVIGQGGLVEGEIRAPVVVISGEVRGDVHAAQRLKLEATAVVTGNLYYRLVEVVVGARMEGVLKHIGAADNT